MQNFYFMCMFPFGLSYLFKGRILLIRIETRGLDSSPDCYMIVDKLSTLYRFQFSRQEDELA